MSKILIYILLISSIIFSCSENKNEFDERFLNAYSEVLIARESISEKSKADSAVAAILSTYNYSEPEFRKEFEVRIKEPQKFMKTLDSIRNLIQIQLDSTELERMKIKLQDNR